MRELPLAIIGRLKHPMVQMFHAKILHGLWVRVPFCHGWEGNFSARLKKRNLNREDLSFFSPVQHCSSLLHMEGSCLTHFCRQIFCSIRLTIQAVAEWLQWGELGLQLLSEMITGAYHLMTAMTYVLIGELCVVRGHQGPLSCSPKLRTTYT